MKNILANYFRAHFPCVAIQTCDEARAMEEILAAAKDAKLSVATWSAMEGAVSVTDGNRPIGDTEDLQAASVQMAKLEDTICVMRDPHTWPFEQAPVLLRAFRDFIAGAPEKGSTVVILAHDFKPHPTIEKLVTVIDFELPGAEDFKKIGEAMIEASSLKTTMTPAVLRACGGLTYSEAENALALSVIETGGFDPKVIYREKTKAVKRSGLLEIIAPDPRGLEAIGGMENMKDWLGERDDVWSDEAVEYGLAAPKGILVVGVPGCGKSLTAKCTGTAFNVPTLKLDVGSLFNSLVGETERRTREALALAEAMAPCVLWLDEMEKGFAGASGSNSDSGTSQRMFGTIISWMQDRKRPVFMFATANDVSALPPELLRKGRFDAIFSVDLPTDVERETIFKIQISARKRNPDDYDLPLLTASTKDFTGSEIEAVVSAAMFPAFKDGRRQFTTDDIIKVARGTTPLAQTAKEKVAAIRDWAKGRAEPASRVAVQTAPKTGRRVAGAWTPSA